MAKISKVMGRNFRELADNQNRDTLVSDFHRLASIAGQLVDMFDRRQIRELVGLHERGAEPADPGVPLTLHGYGRRLYRLMKQVNAAAASHMEVFTSEELELARLSEVG